MNTLTIRISQNKIIFCNYDRLQSLSPDYEIHDNDPDISLNANIHKAIKSLSLPQTNSSFIEACCVGHTTLVPLNEFEEEYVDDIYFFNYPTLKGNNKVFYDTLPYLNALLLFSIDKGVCHSLKETYPQIKFHSTLTPVIQQFASRYPFSTTKPRLYCYMDENKQTIIVIKEGKPAFVNTYSIHNPDDALYYIAAVSQSIELALKDDKIYLCGDTGLSQHINTQLSKIGAQGFVMDDREELSRHPVALVDQFPYDLKVQLLKAF